MVPSYQLCKIALISSAGSKNFYFDFKIDLDFSPDPRTLVLSGILFHLFCMSSLFKAITCSILQMTCTHWHLALCAAVCLVEILRTFVPKIIDAGFLNFDRKFTHSFYFSKSFNVAPTSEIFDCNLLIIKLG